MERPNLKKLLNDKEEFFVVVETPEKSEEIQKHCFDSGVFWIHSNTDFDFTNERILNPTCERFGKYTLMFFEDCNLSLDQITQHAEEQIKVKYDFDSDKVYKEFIDVEGESSGITLRIGG